MFFLLNSELADVDRSLFKRVGAFYQGHDIRAAPYVYLTLGIKGQKTWGKDKVDDLQNTVFFTYEPPTNTTPILLAKEFVPGIVYQYKNKDYVELGHEVPLSRIMTTYIYFLVKLEDCQFAVNESGTLNDIDPSELWDRNFIIR